MSDTAAESASPRPREGKAPVGRKGLDRFRYEYGAGPLHLIAVVVSLLLSGYGLLRIVNLNDSLRVLLWIVAAALLHDLLALPFYSLLSRIADGASGRVIKSRAMMLHALSHVRIPAGLSMLLLLVYSPLIFRPASEAYLLTTGRSLDVYFGRWLLISAAVFLISGVIYAVRLQRGIPNPQPTLAAPAEDGCVAPESAFWRIGAKVVLAGSALAIFWVAAALVVGLVTNGISP